MNKKTIFGFCIALALAASAMFFIKQKENEVAAQVSAALAKFDASAKVVEYSLLSNKLTLKDFKLKNFFFMQGEMQIAEVIVHKPNAQAFDINSKGRPLVAKELMLKNVQGYYMMYGDKQTASIESINVVNWKQNLAKLTALQPQGYTEEFLTALFDCEVEKVVYTNNKDVGPVLVEGKNYTSETNTASITMINLKPNSIESLSMQGMENFTKDNGKVYSTVKLGSATLNNIKVPPPTFWALAIEKISKLPKEEMYGEKAFKILADLESSDDLFANIDLEIKDFIVNFSEGEQPTHILSFKDANFSTNIDTEKQQFAKVKTAFTGVNVNAIFLGLPADDLQMLHTILGDEVLLNASLDLDLVANKTSQLDISLGVENAATLSAKIAADLPNDVFTTLLASDGTGIDGINENLLEQWFTQSKLVSIEKSYEDKSLLPKLLIWLSKTQNMPPSTFWQAASTQILKDIKDNLPFFGQKAMDAIHQCFENPGTLTFNAKPKEAMPTEQAFMALLAKHDSLNLSATCKPGKNIVDVANSLIK